ncbi:uracil-DNA glycosylase [Nocardioides sp.]|uniref:uracil-DNA glycosylase n=1 Tax=Nocardioides sp. TaxID=35761 RepID=UPI00261930BD|nr:uracil-DNA glycosylase [Nocardioides sp.]MDI6912356.1 uracil-DNA glycosylase [Nocardioides sp.]
MSNTDHEAIALLADLDPVEAESLAALAASQQPWPGVLDDEWAKPYYRDLRQFIREERLRVEVYPPQGEVFAAFHLAPFDKVKVVMIGQDPYPNPGEAMGLAFSVPISKELPTSLRNIHHAMSNDGLEPHDHGDLTGWATQGVLLLNLALTVPSGRAGGHLRQWRPFTKSVLKAIDSHPEPMVFVLWGAKAQRIKRWNSIDFDRHGLVEAPHPAARKEQPDFRASKTFSRVNDLLVEFGRQPIRWADQ